MGRITILLILLTTGGNIYGQKHMGNCDSMLLMLNNNNLKELWYSRNFEEKDSSGNILEKKTIVFSNDSLLISIAKCGKAISLDLIQLMSDEKCDYVANYILYMIFRRDALVFCNFYFGTERIEEWREKYKENDLIEWKKLVGML
jgi:hypothetical protein